MASSSAAAQTTEPKARRTHARRSCALCKVRKTRCELPDLDVPSSSDPLPIDKSCHRCKVLELPCVVDDSRTKMRRKKDSVPSGGPSSSSTTSASKRQSASTARTPSEGPLKRPRSSMSRPSSGRSIDDDWVPVNIINHDVDVSEAFQIAIPTRQTQRQWGSPEAGRTSGRQSAAGNRPTRNIRLHGRPLSLTSTLLAIASSNTYSGTKRRRLIIDDVDLEQAVDLNLRTRLAPGYAQLRTYHPHLQPLPDLFSILREGPNDQCVRLLLASSLYVASQSLGADPEAQRLREALAPAIQNLQHNVLAHQPSSFHAIQAFELLAMHAPFSPVLPFQIADPTSLGPARGAVGVALNIANTLNFNALVNGPLERWPNPDFWLWLGLRAAEAQMAFEEERPRKPPLLGEARALTWALTLPENDQQWLSAASIDNPAELLGKLAISDRLARLDELHDTYSRIRGVLETVTNVANFAATQAITEELEFYDSRLLEIDGRHDKVISMLALPSSLESGWKAYRAIRRRWEVMKIYLVGFQTLVALHYLPGSIIAMSGLPTHFQPAQAIHYAFSRANDPHDILLAYASTTMAAGDMRRCAKVRAAQAEQLINSFIEYAPTMVPSQGGADIVPLHEIIAMVVESAKALMEQHASGLTYHRSIMALPPAVPSPHWASALSHASQILYGLSALRTDGDDSSGSGESIANGCSNLLGSMARIVQERSAMVERDGGASIPAIPALASSAATAPVFRFGLPETSSPTAMGPDELQPPAVQTPLRSNSTGAIDTMMASYDPGQMSAGPGGFQSYMPSSDRWMATDTRSNSMPPQSAATSTPGLASGSEFVQPLAPSGHGQSGEAFPPQILTEMFGFESGYGTLGSAHAPPTPLGQQQQQPHSSPYDPRGQVPHLQTTSPSHPHGQLQHAPPHSASAGPRQLHTQQQQHQPPQGPPPPQTPHGTAFQLLPHG